MTPSSNSFSKKTVDTSANSFSQDKPAVSTNEFAKDEVEHGGNPWEGDNLTSGAPPGDFMSGDAPGLGELGGIAHFKGRTKPSITH